MGRMWQNSMLVAKFQETGFAATKKRQIEPPVSNEATKVAILGYSPHFFPVFHDRAFSVF